jgi:hypothetical protein
MELRESGAASTPNLCVKSRMLIEVIVSQLQAQV